MTPTARAFHTLTLLPQHQRALLFGGATDSGVILPPILALNDTWLFGNDTWQLQTTAHTPPARYAHVAVALNSTVYIHGGYDGSGLMVSLADVWMFSVDAGDWVELKIVNSPSLAFHAAALQGSKIYFQGGTI